MGDITVIGLGPGSIGALTEATIKILKGNERVFLRTTKHPVVPLLMEQGLIKGDSFDHFYEEIVDFGEVYRRIAVTLLEEAEKGPVVYAVPGHPLVAEDSVHLLQEMAREKGIKVEIIPAMSFLEPLFQVVGYDPIKGLNIIDALQLDKHFPLPASANVVVQVYSQLVAQDVKISLMDYYPDEHKIFVARAVGVPGMEQVAEVPLYELDRLPWIDYLTSVFIPPLPGAEKGPVKYPMDPLVKIMQQLRSPEGCPWDREQTHESLKKYLIEETYEVLDAIDNGNMNKFCEELGDLLLQIAFHAQIADEEGFFDINDVVKSIAEKLVRRHPHVFGNTRVKNSSEVSYNWDKIKEMEKRKEGMEEASILDSIPKALPALLKAEKVQKRAAKVGFDWPDYRGALDKIYEELEELKEALDRGNRSNAAEEMGDLFFALVNLARFLSVDPEEALQATVDKFIKRFKLMEKKAWETGKKLADLNLDQLDQLWEEAKIVLNQ
ncbi:MazG family protein [Thermincola ferriacetica]|uniref:MazG family protein n=1 Tax=Thermincola ferriacetica TaxID=281456 RepID=A0A0L6W0H3_9FIRM|nr:nucleoside triphosphate pyrophosphohydrolase [Thermincola ferriacetica]KNZ68898.1 MazG family protein [Thermincola ferriacetica]